MQTGSIHIYDFGGFQLDTARRLLRRLDGTPVPLTPRLFETFLYMVEHHDAVLGKERRRWPDSIVEQNNLARAISKLRQVFGETPGSHNYIVTVPGRRCRFVNFGCTKVNRSQSCRYRRRRSALTQFPDHLWNDFESAIDLRAGVEPAKRKTQTPPRAIAAGIHCS